MNGRWWLAAYAVVLLGCAGVAGMWGEATRERVAPSVEWPHEWDGRPVRPLALGDVEQRFAARFPGEIARLTDGRDQVVLRRVLEPTRMLHPASDCYRGAGFTVAGERLETDERQRLWRCFEALRGGQRLRVCERIEDADGAVFTDSSSWFWAALLGRTSGPWQAVTTARAL